MQDTCLEDVLHEEIAAGIGTSTALETSVAKRKQLTVLRASNLKHPDGCEVMKGECGA